MRKFGKVWEEGEFEVTGKRSIVSQSDGIGEIERAREISRDWIGERGGASSGISMDVDLNFAGRRFKLRNRGDLEFGRSRVGKWIWWWLDFAWGGFALEVGKKDNGGER